MTTLATAPVEILSADVPADVRQAAVAYAREALAQTTVECDVAMAIKHKLEAQFGELWHVVVGRSYGAAVAHEAGGMLTFRLRGVAVTAFSSFDESQLVRAKRAHHRAPSDSSAVAAAAPGAPGGSSAADEDEAGQ